MQALAEKQGRALNAHVGWSIVLYLLVLAAGQCAPHGRCEDAQAGYQHEQKHQPRVLKGIPCHVPQADRKPSRRGSGNEG